jgi:hypothetical protein
VLAVRAALRSERPPSYERALRSSKRDPFTAEVERLLRTDPRIPNTRIRDLIGELGYAGGKMILDDHLREVRPRFAPGAPTSAPPTGSVRSATSTLIFAKQAPDILWGMGRCLAKLGPPPRDRGLGPRGGDRPEGLRDKDPGSPLPRD